MILSDPSILKTPDRRKSRNKPLQIYNNTWNVFLFNFSCSSNQFEMFLANYSCFKKCIEKNLVNYSYFDSCPRSGKFSSNHKLMWWCIRTRFFCCCFKSLLYKTACGVHWIYIYIYSQVDPPFLLTSHALIILHRWNHLLNMRLIWI